MQIIRRRIPAKISTVYVCSVCKSRYRSASAAKKCESRPQEEKKFNLGDIVELREMVHCDRQGNIRARGKIIQVLGPLVADEEYENKWLGKMPGMVRGGHVFQYEVKFACKCNPSRSVLLYAPELRLIQRTQNKR